MHWPFVYVPEGDTVQSHSPAEDWGVGVLSGPPLGSPHSFCMDSDSWGALPIHLVPPFIFPGALLPGVQCLGSPSLGRLLFLTEF